LAFRAPRSLVLEGRLGRGGFGEVYRGRLCRDRLVLDVAVKVLHHTLDPRGQGPERLRDEARFLGRLRHRTVPHVHDLALLDGHLAFLVEYIDGIDLSEANARGDLPRRAAFEALADVADALDAAWNHVDSDGVALALVHRDLKPSNIRLGRDGAARLLDFGIARSTAFDRSAETGLDAVLGTPAWMAPERFDRDDGGPASDAWALAAVLWETLAGQRLWHGRDARALLGLAGWQDRYDAAVDERFSLLPSDLPEPLIAMLRAGLRWDAAARPSAASWSHVLREVAPSMPGLGLATWARCLPLGGRGEPTARSGQVYDETEPGVWLPSASDATTVAMTAPPSVVTPDASSTNAAPAMRPRRGPSARLWVALATLGLGFGASGAWWLAPEPSLAPNRDARVPTDAAREVDATPPSAPSEAPAPSVASRPQPKEKPVAKAETETPRTPTPNDRPTPLPAPARAAETPPPIAAPDPPSNPPDVRVQFSTEASAAGAALIDERGVAVRSTGLVVAGAYKLVASFDGGDPRPYAAHVDLPRNSTWDVDCVASLRNCVLRPARNP
jgi:serine/threonine protein kinase